MKKLLYTLATVLVSNLVLAQSTNKNYVKSTSYQQPVKTQSEIDALSSYDITENITYYDGLGRTEQSIALRAGGQGSASQTNALVYDWSLDNYSSSFYQPIGLSSENSIIEDATPFGDTDLLWQCGSDAASDADGGWNTAWQGIDNTKTYRYTVWVKRTGDVTNGRAYHGTYNVNNLNGTSNPNPYFIGTYLPQADTWYLLVGIVHPHNYTGGSTGESGIYDINGTKVVNGNEFKWRPDTTVSRSRNYFYYCTDTSAKQYFWSPLLQEFDGTEYTLSEVQNLNQVQQSANSKDIVTPFKYDPYGRQIKEYLPTPIVGTNGYFTANDAIINDAENYYLNRYASDFSNGSDNIFSEKHLEKSPLSRVLEQAAPGEDWQLDKTSDTDHTIKFDYQTNTALEVTQYTVTFVSGQPDAPQLVHNGDYAANQLYKTITKDENWQPNQGFAKDHTTEEFKNKQGQVVLKRTYDASAGVGNEAHDTYYIYDDYGNLTYVLSPEGSQAIANANHVISQTVLDKLCYQYKYDYRNRLIEKKIPGKGWEFIIYDNLDRPILTQDALQALKSPKQWLFTKYDVLGRVAYTGLFEDNSNRETLQTAVKNHAINNPSVLYESKKLTSITQDPTTVLYYTNTAYPTNPSKIYTINYYDDYNWDIGEDLEASYVFDYNSSYLSNTNDSYTKINTASSWNTGFTSDKIIKNDGYISFEATQLGKRIYVGLTDANNASSSSSSSIGYAIYLGYLNDRVIIFESGVQQPMVTTYYEVGDVFKVERAGNQILYKQNDTIIHISSTASTGDLKGDSSFYDPGTTIDNVFIGHSYLGQAFTNQTKSLATGSKVRVLETNDWITTTSYYDDKARPIYSTSNNTYLQTTEAMGSQLDFVGKVVKTQHTQVRDDDAPIVIVDEFTYDHTGRLLTQQQQINNFNKQLLVKNNYDDLGQLIKKQVGGAVQELSSYTNVSNNITITGNTITKTSASGWDAGLSTVETISGDGYISYNVPKHNNYFMVGFNYTDTDVLPASLDYAIYHTNGLIRIFESGTDLGVKTNYIANDAFKIERRGRTIHYIKNGDIFYTSKILSNTSPLLGDISLFNTNCQVNDLVLVNLESGLQDVDYDYNIRGWLKQINDVDNLANDLFSFKLNYNTKDGSTTVNPLYNGNIAQTIWKTASIDPNQTNVKRGYGYSYDALNRIKTGSLYTGSSLTTSGMFGLSNVSFDKNGNILSLKRENSVGLMDDLTYIYDGNQLQQVDDAIVSMPNQGDQGFNDGNNTEEDYVYDVNGNMIQDHNKNIDDISYNHLNLPTQVQMSTGGIIDYVYDATGVKHKKTVHFPILNGISPVTTTVYANNYIYELHDSGYNTSLPPQFELKFFNHSEGYIEPTIYDQRGGGKKIGDIDYVYQFKDHLGNIRLSYSDSDDNGTVDATEIIEENNYYPFGLEHKGYNNVVNGTEHPYKFGGKEHNEELGLDWYDFGARNYDASLGRWMNLDPLAEQMRRHSPYNYAFNNPIYFIDPDGMKPLDWYLNNENGNYEFFEGSAEREGYTNVGASTDLVVGGEDSYSLNVDGSFENKGTGEVYKKGESLVTDESTGSEIISHLNNKEAVSQFVSDIVAPFLELPQDIIVPIINQINVVVNEGVHEGRAYDSDNVLIKNTYKFENWSFETGRDTQSTGLSYEEGQEVMNNTVSVVATPVKIVKNTIGNTVVKSAIKKTVKEGLEQLED